MEQPAADFRDTTALTFEILDGLRQNAPGCRFVLLSSAAVYGNPAALPVSEEDSIQPLSPYGYHKRQCELLCEEFSRIYGLKTASVRIFSAYGPGLRRQVVWDICQKILGTRELKLHGTGSESRDFIHAADVARALSTIVEHADCEGEIYNLASGREVTIAELAGLLLEQLDGAITPAFDGKVRAGDPCNWRADVSRLAALGFTPEIPLEQGVREVAAWASAELASL
jgi:UDP-glucose 4-epimerase